MMPLTDFRPTPSKIEAILKAGEEQLSPEEFEELEALIFDLQLFGLTPWINVRLGTLMSKIEWELEIEPSPEWEEALIACDKAFLGRELRDMAYDVGASPIGHKKQLCARLYRRKVPEVMAVMEPYLKEMTPEQIKREIERYAQTVASEGGSILPQVEPIWADKVRRAKDRLVRLHKVDLAEFYARKTIIRRAINERKKGKFKTLAEFSLAELEDILHEAEMLYR